MKPRAEDRRLRRGDRGAQVPQRRLGVLDRATDRRHELDFGGEDLRRKPAARRCRRRDQPLGLRPQRAPVRLDEEQLVLDTQREVRLKTEAMRKRRDGHFFHERAHVSSSSSGRGALGVRAINAAAETRSHPGAYGFSAGVSSACSS